MNVPVFIINRDMHTWPRAMVSDILRMGATPIIVDTGSTFPATIEWYRELVKQDIAIELCENHIQHTPWFAGIVDKITLDSDYYIVTDPDLDISGCPDDTIIHLRNLLDRYPDLYKAGLSIEVLDYPDGSPVKEKAIGWETPFWGSKRDSQCYAAPIETTFAIYNRTRPMGVGQPGFVERSVRADRPFTCRHLPFYLTEDYLPDDVLYYLKHASKVSTMANHLEGLVAFHEKKNATKPLGAPG